eukprot:g13821.t1
MMPNDIFHIINDLFFFLLNIDPQSEEYKATIQVPMAGRPFLLMGDFRQTFPILPRATDGQIMQISLFRSRLWTSARVYTLVINERVPSIRHRPSCETRVC